MYKEGKRSNGFVPELVHVAEALSQVGILNDSMQKNQSPS